MCQSDLENNQGRTQGGQNDLIVHDGGLRPTAGSTLEKIALILLRLFRGERKKKPQPLQKKHPGRRGPNARFKLRLNPGPRLRRRTCFGPSVVDN